MCVLFLCIGAASWFYISAKPGNCLANTVRANSTTLQGDAEMQNSPLISFFALGDWGKGNSDQHLVATALLKAVDQARISGLLTEPFVLGLGDYFYSKKWARNQLSPAELETEIMRTFGSVYTNKQEIFPPLVFHLVPGNHDHLGNFSFLEDRAERMFDGSSKKWPIWNFYSGREKGTAEVQSPEKLLSVDSTLDIFAIDTQYLLEAYAQNSETKVENYWHQLSTLISQSKSRWKIVVGHHPVLSHGQHAKPHSRLRHFVNAVWRHSLQDLDTPEYSALRKKLQQLLHDNHVDFYLSGHDHSLQFVDLGGNQFQVVSGAGSESSAVRMCENSVFAKAAIGFVGFDINEREARLRFYSVDYKENDEVAQFVVRKNIHPPL